MFPQLGIGGQGLEGVHAGGWCSVRCLSTVNQRGWELLGPGTTRVVDTEAACYLPEPLYDLVTCAVAVLVLCVLPPVAHIHVSQPAHEKLETDKTVNKESNR